MWLTCENRDSLLNFFLDFFKIWTNKNTGSQNLKDKQNCKVMLIQECLFK